MNVESSGYPNSELNLLRHEMGDSVREYPKNGEVMETPDIEPGFELDDLYDNSDNQSNPESDPTDPVNYKHIAFSDARLARLAGRIASGQTTADLENRPLGCDRGADLPRVFKINPGKIR